MPAKKKSQKERILSWLKRGRRLTQMKALELFDCQALHARIHNLKKDGYKIKSRLIETNTGKRVAEYSL